MMLHHLEVELFVEGDVSGHGVNGDFVAVVGLEGCSLEGLDNHEAQVVLAVELVDHQVLQVAHPP